MKGSFSDRDSMKEYVEESPKYFKPAEKPGMKGSMRVAILTEEFPLKLVYSLKDKNCPPDKNNFRGTFLSLTGDGGKTLKSREIRKLLNTGDPEGKLKIDVKTFGRAPGVATILPVLKYVTDASGKPDVEAFKAGVFEVGFLYVTDQKLRDITDEFAQHEGKSIQDLDFFISSSEKSLTWKIRADEKSLYGKNRENPVLAKKVAAKLAAEFDRLSVSNLDELVDTYLARSMTEDQWAEKLTEFGYITGSSTKGVSAPPAKTASKVENVAAPTIDDAIDFESSDEDNDE